MKKLGVILVMAACLPLAGCFTVASPAVGTLFADVKWDGGVANGPIGAKSGTACEIPETIRSALQAYVKDS